MRFCITSNTRSVFILFVVFLQLILYNIFVLSTRFCRISLKRKTNKINLKFPHILISNLFIYSLFFFIIYIYIYIMSSLDFSRYINYHSLSISMDQIIEYHPVPSVKISSCKSQKPYYYRFLEAKILFL